MNDIVIMTSGKFFATMAVVAIVAYVKGSYDQAKYEKEKKKD